MNIKGIEILTLFRTRHVSMGTQIYVPTLSPLSHNFRTDRRTIAKLNVSTPVKLGAYKTVCLTHPFIRKYIIYVYMEVLYTLMLIEINLIFHKRSKQCKPVFVFWLSLFANTFQYSTRFYNFYLYYGVFMSSVESNLRGIFDITGRADGTKSQNIYY